MYLAPPPRALDSTHTSLYTWLFVEGAGEKTKAEVRGRAAELIALLPPLVHHAAYSARIEDELLSTWFALPPLGAREAPQQ